MGDIIDRAQAYDELYREGAITAHLAMMRQGSPLDAATECIECGDEIPENRRRAVPGALRCVSCQAKIERR